jgi:hypothetical protein
MIMERIKRLLAILGLLAVAGCGAPDGQGGGAIAVRVGKARSFNPRIEHGRIEAYRVTVSGPGIDPAIVGEFPGDAAEGVIEGVPTGEGRSVEVLAINPNGIAIRAGEASGVKVEGGVNEVPVELEAIPIFTNVADGNTVVNTRLAFRIFSDPADPISVEERGHGVESALVDAATNLSELRLDESTGMGRFAPALMEPGVRSFAAVDLVTGREHEVRVRVVEGRGRRPAPIVSAAGTGGGSFACSAPACAP